MKYLFLYKNLILYYRIIIILVNYNIIVNFGNNPNNVGYNFNGYIDKVKIYNRQLSTEEVVKNYNVMKKRFNR